MESTKFVTTWIREEKLDTILPNAPKITSGKIVAHSDRVLRRRVARPHRNRMRARLAGPSFVDGAPVEARSPRLPPSYDPELASYLRIEERELEAGGVN